MALPPVKAFCELFQDDYIVIAAPAWAEPIFTLYDNVEVIPFESNELHGLKGVAAQIRRLKKNKYDLGVIMPPSFSSASVFSMLGVERRFGYIDDGRKLLLNCPVARPEQIKLHRMHQYQLLLEYAAGWKLKTDPAHLEPDEQSIVKASSLLERGGIENNEKYLAIAPQAVAESRRWGAANYSALAVRVYDTFRAKTVLLGTAGERESGERVKDNHDYVINLCGETDIMTASAILAKASLFAGNDSGLAHLAGASGTAIVVLSGADDPEETSPMNPYKMIIIKDRLECISCVRNSCPLIGEQFMRCMKEITVAEVFEAVSFYLEG